MKAKWYEATENRGIWVIDRGGDRGELFDELVPSLKGRRFIVRQVGDWHLLWGRWKLPELAIANKCPLPYSAVIVKEDNGKEKVYHLEYGFRPVLLPAHTDAPLWLVVVAGFGEKPLMLLTNVPMRKNRELLWWLVSAYLSRWRIEETMIRFGKNRYNLEDIRVQTYDRLRNMFTLVMAAMFFASVVLGTQVKLKILSSHVLKVAKRLFGIPDFRYYAIADGIKEIFSRRPRGKSSKPRGDPNQMLMFNT